MNDDEGGHGRTFRLIAAGLQLSLVALIVYGTLAGKIGVAVNGALSLAVTVVPALLERRFDHEVDPRLKLWITVAATIHVAGFLGPYDAQSGLLAWYDQVAHAVSAAFVAGVGYAFAEALDRGSDRLDFPELFRFVFVLCFVMAFGVLWEIGEFAGGIVGRAVSDSEILVQYGIEDIVSDLVFNTLAGGVVALWGTRYFEDIAEIVRDRFTGGSDT